MNSGRIDGNVIRRKIAQLPAPSTLAASYWSPEIVRIPARRLNATNGTACQTISRVMTKNVESPVSNQEWFVQSPKIPTLVSAQWTPRNLLSNSHWKMTLAVSTGVAQARIRAIESARRIQRLNGPRSQADALANSTRKV